MNRRLANIILQVFVVIWIIVSAGLIIAILVSQSNGWGFVQAVISLILSAALFIYIRKKS